MPYGSVSVQRVGGGQATMLCVVLWRCAQLARGSGSQKKLLFMPY